MRIAFFLNLPLCQNLIHDVVTVKFAHHLAELGTEIHFYYSGHAEEGEIARYYGIIPSEELHFHPTKRLKIEQPVKLSWSLVTKADMALQLIRLIRQGQCDLVFTNDSSLIPLQRICDHYRIPFVFEAHDIPPDTTLPYLFTTTDALRKKIRGDGAEAIFIETLHLSPNITEFHPSPYRSPEELKTLLYAGKLSWDRGAYLLVDTLARLGPGFRLVLFGGSPKDVTTLRNYASEKGVAGAIRLEGFVPPNELERRLGETTGIQIIPPPDRDRYHYIAHTKIFDALGRGKLIVASDLEPIREVAEGVAFFFRPGDAGDLAQKIMKVASLPLDEANAMASAMEERFRKFSYRARCRRFLGFVDTILPSQERRAEEAS